MIRIIVKMSSAMPCGDWPVSTEYKTFDVSAPKVAAFVKEFKKNNTYCDVSISGVEFLDDPA
jgi:hypothetical protein